MSCWLLSLLFELFSRFWLILLSRRWQRLLSFLCFRTRRSDGYLNVLIQLHKTRFNRLYRLRNSLCKKLFPSGLNFIRFFCILFQYLLEWSFLQNRHIFLPISENRIYQIEFNYCFFQFLFGRFLNWSLRWLGRDRSRSYGLYIWNKLYWHCFRFFYLFFNRL